MNTNQLKPFAQKARNIIRNGVARQLNYWGFDEKGNILCQPKKVGGGVVHREQPIDDPKIPAQWEALRTAVRRQGFDQVVEEAAYTWFNRIMAIRILAKNGYDLPQLDYSSEGAQIPLILQRARRGQYAFLNSEEQTRLNRVLADYTQEAKAFAILLTGYCHAHTLLNNVFGRMDDYTEMLLPADMLDETGFIHFLNTTTAISDDDYRQVELIGWLYQFYISEKKDEVFKQFKKNQKAEAKDIPAATQIFTPNWIVKYMVENTVGKLWLDQNPDSPIKTNMKYLVESPNNAPAQAPPLGGWGVLDPASGSGHILVEAFDLLYQMYMEDYYMPDEAVESILQNNLFGLDIDLRAAQLARFALLMKAAAKHPGILKTKLLPKVFAMPAPEEFSRQDVLDFLGSEGLHLEEKLTAALELMQQAQNLGSIMQFDITDEERALVVARLDALKSKAYPDALEVSLLNRIAPYIEVLAILTRRYEAIAANPPYMGQGNMNAELKNYINTRYPLSKSDLFAVFMEVCLNLNVVHGLMGMINQHSWMFLSSYEKLRLDILEKYSIANMLHLGPRTFVELSGEVVQSTAFVLAKNTDIQTGSYFRLVEYKNNEEKETHFLQRNNGFFNIPQSNFSKIPGSPIAYWVSSVVFSNFDNFPKLEDKVDIRSGISTGNNDEYYRLWFEVDYKRIEINLNDFSIIDETIVSDKKWFFIIKGGENRKWYGNRESIINLRNNGEDIKKSGRNFRLRTPSYYNKKGLTWSRISSNNIAFRIKNKETNFGENSPCLFIINEEEYFLALLNSKVVFSILSCINPTLTFQVIDVAKIPIVIDDNNKLLTSISKKCIVLSRLDWDSRETSWDFQTSPLFDALLGDIGMATSQFAYSRLQHAFSQGALLQQVYIEYLAQWSSLFYQLHANEEELNRIFIDIYGLNEELDPMVPLKDITILQDELETKALEKTDLALRKRRHWKRVEGKWELTEDESKPLPALPIKRDVVMKQFISYAIGCMMGRYALEKPGLILANHGDTLEEYRMKVYGSLTPPSGGWGVFGVDDDAIIPLMGTSSTFPDDAVNRFNHFLEVVWGADNLTQNKNFMQDCLDQEIEKYLVNSFWKDHCRTYKKKPIYWLFCSEKGAFQVLVYMHRMNRFTVERIRSMYLLKHLQYLQQEIDRMAAGPSLNRDEQKRLDNLRTQYSECQRYDLLLKDCADRQINFDLDEGISANYELFKGVVAPIK